MYIYICILHSNDLRLYSKTHWAKLLQRVFPLVGACFSSPYVQRDGPGGAKQSERWVSMGGREREKEPTRPAA